MLARLPASLLRSGAFRPSTRDQTARSTTCVSADSHRCRRATLPGKDHDLRFPSLRIVSLVRKLLACLAVRYVSTRGFGGTRIMNPRRFATAAALLCGLIVLSSSVVGSLRFGL